MATTPNFSWILPTVGSDGNLWGGLLNGNLSSQDTILRYAFNSFAGASAPVSPTIPARGMLWLNTTANPYALNIYDGADWVQIGTLDADGNQFRVATPSVVVGDYKYSLQAATGNGWSLCDGSSLNILDYTALFAIIGYQFGGTGDDFFLPDMRGAVPGGIGLSGLTTNVTNPVWLAPTTRVLATYTGEETHLLTIPEIPSHTHTYNASTNAGNTASGGATTGGTLTTNATGGGGSHNTMQPTVFFGNYFVYTGVFP